MTLVAKPSIVQLTKALAIAGAFVTFGCAEPRVDASSQLGRQWVHQGEAQGTTYTIKYVSRDSVPHAAFESCLEQVDVEMNAWRPESTLSQFNAFTEIDSAFRIPDESHVWTDLWNISNEAFLLSGGTFDVTLGPMMKLWGFRMQHRDLVSNDQVDSVMAFSRLHPDVVMFESKMNELGEPNGVALTKKDPRVELDFNAVAQGYTVDRLVRVLADHEVQHLMVELGGEVRCHGGNAKGLPWRIAIDRPQAEGRSLQAVLPVRNQSVCTSGNYRKVSVVNGKRFSHTIDPRTGRPVTHRLLSATIVAPDAAVADAYATACMVMGPDHGSAWLDSLRKEGHKLEALFIMDGQEGGYSYWATPDLEGQLEWIEPLDKYSGTKDI